mgnify:FL=1|jgi:hypothetical protein
MYRQLYDATAALCPLQLPGCQARSWRGLALVSRAAAVADGQVSWLNVGCNFRSSVAENGSTLLPLQFSFPCVFPRVWSPVSLLRLHSWPAANLSVLVHIVHARRQTTANSGSSSNFGATIGDHA